MKEFFGKLFASDFMPHATCYLWKPEILGLHVCSDLMIALAYYSIPVALAVFARRRKDLAFKPVFILFAFFILLCGTTHLMEVYTIWHPVYRVSGLLKLVTGIISLFTAAFLWPLIPKALLIPSSRDLQAANEELRIQIEVRTRIENELQQHKDQLEVLVQERTRELEEKIRETELARQQITFQASLLEQVKNAVIVTNNDYRIIYWNKYAEEVFGWTSEEVMGKDSVEIFQIESQPLRRQNINDSIRTRQVWEQEIPLKTKDDRTIPALITGSVWRNQQGEAQGHIAVVVDISERKRAEEELKHAMEKAEESARAKHEFLSVISHEIRTPLNAVVNVAHLLWQDEPKPEQMDNLNILQISATHLLALINDILDFSKIESRKIEFENIDFDLRELVKGVIHTFSYQAIEKQLQLQLHLNDDIPAVLTGDPVRLTQILNNLISNAIKFTEAGQVMLSVEPESIKEGQAALLFSVTDTGIGIEADKIDRIFDSFTQANSSTTREYGGTGLGLTISKMLVELQGGHIGVESTPRKGTVFSFSLTYQVSHNPVPKSKFHKNKDYNLHGTHILLVDDNPLNRAIGIKFLRKWNAEVDIAENGKIAVEKTRQNRYDLILMDLRMPVMDGYQATLQLREMGVTLPVLALTASMLSEVKGKIYEAGINDYVFKPINPDELYQKILTHLQGKMQNPTGSHEISSHREIMTLEELIASAPGDVEFGENLLLLYEDEVTTLPHFIREYMHEGSYSKIRDLIHRVLPSLQRLPGFTLENELLLLRQLIIDNRITELEPVAEQIHNSCRSILKYIARIRQRMSGESE